MYSSGRAKAEAERLLAAYSTRERRRELCSPICQSVLLCTLGGYICASVVAFLSRQVSCFVTLHVRLNLIAASAFTYRVWRRSRSADKSEAAGRGGTYCSGTMSALVQHINRVTSERFSFLLQEVLTEWMFYFLASCQSACCLPRIPRCNTPESCLKRNLSVLLHPPTYRSRTPAERSIP